MGHALESYLLTQPGREVLHGEAVAAGLVCESWLSVQHGLLSAEELDKIETFVFSVFDKMPFCDAGNRSHCRLCRCRTRKTRGTPSTAPCCKGIGHGVFDQPVTVAEIAESLRYYHRL